MGLIRIAILLLLAWVTWRLIRGWLAQRQSRGNTSTPGPQPRPLPMVRCELCQVHLPASESVRHQSRAFCCPEHRNAWLERHGD